MRTEDVLAIILADGVGQKLFPRNKRHANPAMLFDGPYAPIDSGLSNTIDAGIRRILVIVQHNSTSLDEHIKFGWDVFSPAISITLLPLKQAANANKRVGSALALHQNLDSIKSISPKYVFIFSANHTCKMDYSKLMHSHESRQADLTVGTIEVPLIDAQRLRILRINDDYRATGFTENPEPVSSGHFCGNGVLAATGIYMFNTDKLLEILTWESQKNTLHDFGASIMPSILNSYWVYVHPFECLYR